MPILGTDSKSGSDVVLTDKARRQGTYVIGTTGTGKTTLLESIAYQDMVDPSRPGLCVLDPHGDFVGRLLTLVPPARRDDVILFAPGAKDQFEQPMGLNILACDRSDPRQVRRVISTVIDTLYKLFAYSWGPRMEDLLRNSILALMATPDTTLLDLLLLLASPKHRERYTGVPTLERRKKDKRLMDNFANPVLKDSVVRHFWEVQMANLDQRTLTEVTGSSLNKIGRFLSDPMVRNVVAQPKNSFDIRRIMDEGKILLVDLSKGDSGEDNTALLGSVIVNLILIAALQRRDIPQNERRPFHLIVDEYQSFATTAFPTLQSEGRKYAIDVVVAHQYRDQLDDLNKGSTLNVANFITLRVTGKDSIELASQFDNSPPAPLKQMQPLFAQFRNERLGTSDRLFVPHEVPNKGLVYHEVELPRRAYTDMQQEKANQLSVLPEYHAMCRLVDTAGQLTETLIKIKRVEGRGDTVMANYIRNRSLQLGTSRFDVEKKIAGKIGDRLEFDVPAIQEIEEI